ncbi:Pectate lyase superfamily protein [Paucidesulfovibrio gracilis DSM 16080]|uniref:Pectate lyase superfamily protein n=1 Tax=Paucidesulfovibrio gracilis DSM 16080 TaxID=1121449 RepID=A0A1T4XF35_9BACT|nr:glycosyl hydrolase family 28-related protein [Paucidesulfovibrio gracilis]SKA87655.1 Pectate lyase superfamily protein [Paucidesulfovibrio gracilis DSM 16080]
MRKRQLGTVVRLAPLLAALAFLLATGDILSPRTCHADAVHMPPGVRLMPTVRAPFQDGPLALDAPVSDFQPELTRLGYLDVTLPPFLADPTGKTDTTKALQRAIDHARDHQLVCFFPSGIYRISDTLEATQQYYQRSNGQIMGARFFPCVLQGSADGPRPVIELAPFSPGFDRAADPKPMLHFRARKRTRHGVVPNQFSSNINFNQMLRGIDIRVGRGNGGAIGIQHGGAQGSGVQDCTIDVRNGFIGMREASGAGGGQYGITVLGGKIGLDFGLSEPVPTLVGTRLIGQERHALVYSGMNTLVAAGLEIESNARGPLIRSKAVRWGPQAGPMSIVDAAIRMPKGGTAIEAARPLYLKDVTIEGASVPVLHPDGVAFPEAAAGRLTIREYARGVLHPPFTMKERDMDPATNPVVRLQNPVYLPTLAALQNETPQASRQSVRDRIALPASLAAEAYAPPRDYRALLASRQAEIQPPVQHKQGPGLVSGSVMDRDLVAEHLWPPRVPPLEIPGIANVLDYGAKGDGRTDDTAAIQQAIDEHPDVFLPKGYFRLTRPLRLRPDTRLLGVSKNLSFLCVTGNEPGIVSTTGPKAMVVTADATQTSTEIENVGFYLPVEADRVAALSWRCGGQSLLKDILIFHHSLKGFDVNVKRFPQREQPLLLVEGHGGGAIYNYYHEDHIGQGPGYRHLLVRDTPGPLRFYQLDIEHAKGSWQSEIRHAGTVEIYGLKGEGHMPVLRAEDVRKLALYGTGGNAAAKPGTVLLSFENVDSLTLANVNFWPRLTANVFLGSRGYHPKDWSVFRDVAPDGTVRQSPPQAMPTLYRRP